MDGFTSKTTGTLILLTGILGILGAVLASVLQPTLRRFTHRLSLFLLIGVWAGAVAVTFGSWLIVAGRSDVELSSYYFMATV